MTQQLRRGGIPPQLLRFMAFAGIGVLCLILVQEPILYGLQQLGSEALAANAVAFIASAVVNYMIQRATTFRGDRQDWSKGLLTFLAASGVSLIVNEIVFGAVHYIFGVPALICAGIAGVVSSANNFLLSHMFVFKTASTTAAITETEGEYADRVAASIALEDRPDVRNVLPITEGKRLAFFLPAYKEAANLEHVIAYLVASLRQLELAAFVIHIVNDGSPDDTGEVAEALARLYPEVVVLHHATNQGYGGALTTGFRAVAATEFDYWAFMDADRQFDPKSLWSLLWELGETDADMVVGIRIGRRNSDSTFRFYLGRTWHFFGKAIVGWKYLRATDVDCGLKMGRVPALQQIAHRLGGKAAAISPELIARATVAGHRIAERHVAHLPRVAGTSTGGKPLVMLRSAFSILRLGIALRLERLAANLSGSSKKGSVQVVVYDGSEQLEPACAGE